MLLFPVMLHAPVIERAGRRVRAERPEERREGAEGWANPRNNHGRAGWRALSAVHLYRATLPGYKTRIENDVDRVSVGWGFSVSFSFLANSPNIQEFLEILLSLDQLKCIHVAEERNRESEILYAREYLLCIDAGVFISFRTKKMVMRIKKISCSRYALTCTPSACIWMWWVMTILVKEIMHTQVRCVNKKKTIIPHLRIQRAQILSLCIFVFLDFWKRIFTISSIKCRLITNLICKLRDESNEPN